MAKQPIVRASELRTFLQRARTFLFASVLILSTIACRDSQVQTADKREVTPVIVLAAASTTNVLESLAADYEQAHPEIDVTLSFGPSNALAEQVVAGGKADVFITASPAWVTPMEAAGLIHEQREYCRNRLALVVPSGNPARVTRLEDLAEERIERVAIADKSVPAGMYAEQALAKLGLLDQLIREGKVARGSDVRTTLTYVELAEADAGLVYETDVRVAKGVEMVMSVPAELIDAPTYVAVLLRSDENATSTPTNEAAEFYEFLFSDSGQQRLDQFGFIPVSTIGMPRARDVSH